MLSAKFCRVFNCYEKFCVIRTFHQSTYMQHDTKEVTKATGILINKVGIECLKVSNLERLSDINVGKHILTEVNFMEMIENSLLHLCVLLAYA